MLPFPRWCFAAFILRRYFPGNLVLALPRVRVEWDIPPRSGRLFPGDPTRVRASTSQRAAVEAQNLNKVFFRGCYFYYLDTFPALLLRRLYYIVLLFPASRFAMPDSRHPPAPVSQRNRPWASQKIAPRTASTEDYQCSIEYPSCWRQCQKNALGPAKIALPRRVRRIKTFLTVQNECRTDQNQFSAALAAVSFQNREFSECRNRPKHAPHRARLGAFSTRALRGAWNEGALGSRPFVFTVPPPSLRRIKPIEQL